jgi:hypothetical protein
LARDAVGAAEVLAHALHTLALDDGFCDLDEARRAIKLGLVSLVGSIAIEQVLDTLTNRWEATGLEWPDVLRNGIEEAAKLAGWIGLAGGLTGLLLCRLLTAAAADRG